MMRGAARAVDPAIAAAYAQALERTGIIVFIQRVNGVPPCTSLISARVPAVIYDRGGEVPTPGDGGIGIGALTESDRWLVVNAADLARQRYPLPVTKDDKVILASDPSNKLTIRQVDQLRRGIAGAIEIKADGL